jgi:hypothetical protein
METTDRPVRATRPTSETVLGSLLDALAQRDFDAMRTLLAEDVRFRALVPPGAFELHTADEVAATFRRWFGGEDDFEVLEATLGEVGSRPYARWRVRMWPPGRAADSRVAEQHVFTTGTGRVESLDLLCSGFQRGNR